MAGIATALRQHRRVGLDTAVFIYHLEGTSSYAASAGIVFRELAGGAFEGVTSVLTLMELTVRPLQLGRLDVANEYEVILANYPYLTIVPLDRAMARQAAHLRASYRLRPADALQVAACLEQGATAFLTNDAGLRHIAELQLLVLADFVENGL